MLAGVQTSCFYPLATVQNGTNALPNRTPGSLMFIKRQVDKKSKRALSGTLLIARRQKPMEFYQIRRGRPG
jgi:hypothetical protein